MAGTSFPRNSLTTSYNEPCQQTTVKEDKPVSKDVVKAAANLKGIQANYNQAYRCIQSNNVRAREDDKVSFQLIIPYLSKFMMKSNR